MRALKVVGLAAAGGALICEDADGGEQFELSADELRAAAGLHRQRRFEMEHKDREIAMEPQLRPRDIQSRIRLGASLDEVAEAAGCDPSRIERYAYPVLMERASIAERAQRAYPIVNGAHGKTPVSELAAEVLAERGQADSIRWDAYRTEAGSWVLLLAWTAGHTENTARFSFSPGSPGGTVTPLDDAAAGIVDPAPRPLRTVPDAEVEAEPEPPVNPLVLQGESQPALIPEPAPRIARPQPSGSRSSGDAAGGNKVAAALANHAAKGSRPAMPSWEDVLLGVRSSNL